MFEDGESVDEIVFVDCVFYVNNFFNVLMVDGKFWLFNGMVYDFKEVFFWLMMFYLCDII